MLLYRASLDGAAKYPEKDRAECVDYLLRKRVVDLESDSPSAFTHAAYRGHLNAIRIMVEAGAYPLCREGGLPPLGAAVIMRQPAVVEYLLKSWMHEMNPYLTSNPKLTCSILIFGSWNSR